VRLMASKVEFEPVPAMTGNASRRSFDTKADYAFVLFMGQGCGLTGRAAGYQPLEPCDICHSTNRWKAASSILPSVKGVIKAVIDPENIHNLRRLAPISSRP